MVPLVKSVRLRPFAMEDLPAYEHWLQPGQEWHRWDGPYFPKPTTADIQTIVSRMRTEIAEPTGRPTEFAIVDGDDGLIGRVSWHWEHEASQWARCGVTVFDPQTRGQGVGERAMRLLADEVFGSSAAQRLDFATWSGNTAMCRVGEKLGWILEARFRAAREVRGARYDSVVYGVLRSEWRSGADFGPSRPDVDQL